jgi:hypothetical protein
MAVKDGGESPIDVCPECGGTYLRESNFCMNCELTIDARCAHCDEQLGPSNMSFDDSELCVYCSNRLHSFMRD